jgi:hypothetical protein
MFSARACQHLPSRMKVSIGPFFAPDVVDEFVGPYDPGHHVARMNANAP